MPEETVEKKGTPEAGIIVVSHADYGSAILRTAEFILGPLSDCTSISVDVGQEVPETVRRLKDAAERLDKGAGVIVLTDMFGGTPTNLALSLLSSLKVFSSRTLPLAELAEVASEAGVKGIVVPGAMLKHRHAEKSGEARAEQHKG